MQMLYDFIPVVLFFIGYKLAGIYAATAIAMAISIAQVTAYYLRHKKFEPMQVITLILLLLLGGTTLALHNETFIKWKPTVINWVFALGFILSHFIGKKPLIQRLLDKNINLPNAIWNRLSLSWIAFFILLGIANLFVIYHFDTDTWVNFKLFGMLGLTVLFTIAQSLYLAKYLKGEHDSTRQN